MITIYTMGIKQIGKLAVFTSLLLSMEMPALTADYPPGPWDKIIDGKDFTNVLSLDSGDDNTLIIN